MLGGRGCTCFRPSCDPRLASMCDVMNELSQQTLLDPKRFALQAIDELEQVAFSFQVLLMSCGDNGGVTACPLRPEGTNPASPSPPCPCPGFKGSLCIYWP